MRLTTTGTTTNKRSRRLKIISHLIIGGTLWIDATCGSIVVDSVRDGLFNYVSGSLIDASFTTQLNEFVINVFSDVFTTSSTAL